MIVTGLQPEFVEEFPAAMKPGVLYVSLEYRTCGHLCACGCGHEVTTPLSPAQWALTFDGESMSLWPSIGNWVLPCQSHYVLDRGRIRWARTFSPAEIRQNRRRDRSALQAAARDASGSQPVNPQDAGRPSRPNPRSWWRRSRFGTRVAARLRRLLKQ